VCNSLITTSNATKIPIQDRISSRLRQRREEGRRAAGQTAPKETLLVKSRPLDFQEHGRALLHTIATVSLPFHCWMQGGHPGVFELTNRVRGSLSTYSGDKNSCFSPRSALHLAYGDSARRGSPKSVVGGTTNTIACKGSTFFAPLLREPLHGFPRENAQCCTPGNIALLDIRVGMS
jgi:hypothetical protein